MSGRIVGEILENAPTDLTTAERFVLVTIGEDARDRDRIAQYSDVETLAYRTCLKPGTVRNALSELARRALIEPLIERVHRGGKHQEYRIPKLEPHHRNATKTKPTNGQIVSFPDDVARHSRVTR